MTTSSRMEHQHSIQPGYPHHHHHSQESLHPHHSFNPTGPSSDHSPKDSLPPLAYLSEVAASQKDTIASRQRDHDTSASEGGHYHHHSNEGSVGHYRLQHNSDHSRKGRDGLSNETLMQSDTSFSSSSGTSSPHEDADMNATTAPEAMDHSDGPRRGSMSMDHTASLTPTPSPQGRPADYPHDHPSYHHYNGSHHHPKEHHHLASPDQFPSYAKHHPDHDHDSQHYHKSHAHATPSPPLPTPEGYQGRNLPPMDRPPHGYLSESRRGSIADPEYHAAPGGDAHRRPSIAAMDTSNGYVGASAGGGGGGGGSAGDGRHYATTPPPHSVPTSSEPPHYPPYPPHHHPSTSPMQLRQSEHALGRRESLPSIHSSAGPLGQLLAQEPQRRHSIAHGDHMGPLRRKTSATPLSQMHAVDVDHSTKRRDSIPDAAHPYHHHLYRPSSRSSLSAPSSPPRRGSIAAGAGSGASAPHGQVPTLNLQPAAEIKQNGPMMMEHGRPHFPLHQPRRPSLLSDASLSRRSSIADGHHYPSHFQQHHPSPDYDHNMNVDMERMHLSNHGEGHGGPQGYAGGPSGPSGAGGPGGHLYPGYSSSSYPPEGNGGVGPGSSAKGDTPYSRSPELRISHKLAERKRRKEMKELFDELRDSLPVDRSLKTSKWEILSKAVDFISSIKTEKDEMTKELESLREEVDRLRKQQQ